MLVLQSAFGDWVSDLANIAKVAAGAAGGALQQGQTPAQAAQAAAVAAGGGAAAAIDPDLASIYGTLVQIVKVERAPGGLMDPAGTSTFKLADLKAPLEQYLYVRKNPYKVYGAVAGTAALLLALAFVLGRVSKRGGARA